MDLHSTATASTAQPMSRQSDHCRLTGEEGKHAAVSNCDVALILCQEMILQAQLPLGALQCRDGAEVYTPGQGPHLHCVSLHCHHPLDEHVVTKQVLAANTLNRVEDHNITSNRRPAWTCKPAWLALLLLLNKILLRLAPAHCLGASCH